METRKFFVPGIIFLFVAFFLTFLTSISLPTIHTLDIVRIHSGGSTQGIPDNLKDVIFNQIRFGIWGFCKYDLNDDSVCVDTGHGYQFQFFSVDDNFNLVTTTLGASWTRGLAVHPVATAFIFIALCLSFSSQVTALLAATITSFLASFLTLLAFIIDIAFYAYVHHKAKDLNSRLDVDTAPGFWLTFVSLLFTLFATCTIFVGRRRSADSSASYPMMTNPTGLLSRFRKN